MTMTHQVIHSQGPLTYAWFLQSLSITRQVAALAVMDKHGEEREYFQLGKGLGLTPPP